MSNRKYLRLADGYHDRSPYNPHQSSGKYSSKQVSSVSDSRSERSSNVNGGSGSRNNSPRSRHSTMSPRSHRAKSSYSKTKELYKRGSSSSPVDAVSHNPSSSDRMLKTNSISTDDMFPWSQHTSSSGKTYYYNCKTEKSQWEKPKEWIEREQASREKKRREKSEYSRENSNHISSKEKPRDHRERTSSKNTDDKSERHRDENRRVPQYYQGSLHIVKTTANTSAITTTLQRPDHLSARAESKVSPANSLQDISPPVTPSTIIQNNSSPIIGTSPIISKHSPVTLTVQRSPNLQNRSPGPPIPHPPLPTHHGNSPTPPPPPPPPPPPSSSMQNLHGVSTQSSPQINVQPPSTKLPDVSYNGIHVFSQSHLHPLQQATLLQAQFQTSNVRPMTSGMISASPPAPHFQPIRQPNSTPSSPLPFSTRIYSSNSPAQATQNSKSNIPYVAPQQINIQDLAAPFNRGLIAHTLGWPSEPLEKQSQKLSEETLGLHSINNQLKADLIPLNFHHNLTAMRMSVGDKRIKFLREQTKKLEASDWIS